jgi:hypothetical protein
MRFPTPRRFRAVAAVVFLQFVFPMTNGFVRADVPSDPAERERLIGQPVGISVTPSPVILGDAREWAQVVVTGRYANGTVRDLTPLCDLQCSRPELVTIDGGCLKPQQVGEGTLHVRAGSQQANIPVVVRGSALPVSFSRELIAALNVGGCNQGACHGSPSGKNGFRLSLRGSDPALDYQYLTRDVLGRRTDREAASDSLIWQKAVGRVPHDGGSRFARSSQPAVVLHKWLAEGLRDDAPGMASVAGIEITPGPRMLEAPARWQQLAVRARFTDGSSRDVTRLTVFSSSDTAVASVSQTGLVEFSGRGETAILCRYLGEMRSVRIAYLEPRKDFRWMDPPANNYVDTQVNAKLKRMQIIPADLCRDDEFLRRATLDVCGVLPSVPEVKAFLSDSSADKRARLIDRLLERPEYADLWTLKWADLLRSNRRAIQPKGVYVLQEWLHDKISGNVPFDQIVRELLTSKGDTFAQPAANYYRVARDPTSLAETTAQLFFGIRLQCCKCHNHPFERWTQDDYYSLAAYFARVRQKTEPTTSGGAAELIYEDRSGEVTNPRTGKVVPPRPLGGKPGAAGAPDRRLALAEWIISPDNAFFARSLVNRIWFHVVGRGIVDPVDDFRDSNPPANDELLDALARDFVAHKFDVKHLIRTILNSRTYQLSARTNTWNQDDSRYFSHATTRLLSAEQLLDAICMATQAPEKYAGMPDGTRATQLPDGEIQHVFLKTFGQPARELACECERENESSLTQALQLVNGATINDKVRKGDNHLHHLLTAKTADRDIVNELYLATLSRRPNESEIKTALAHVAKGKDRGKAWEDVQWALLNSSEFLFRH